MVNSFEYIAELLLGVCNISAGRIVKMGQFLNKNLLSLKLGCYFKSYIYVYLLLVLLSIYLNFRGNRVGIIFYKVAS